MSEARIYKVPILVSRMKLPITVVIIAADETAAVEAALDPHQFGVARLNPCVPIEELGVAHNPEPRIFF